MDRMRTIAATLVLMVAVGGAGVWAADRDRERMMDQDPDMTRDRMMDQDRMMDRDRVMDPEGLDDRDIYGWELMTPKERWEHRERMRSFTGEEEREQYRREHHDRMQERAKEQGRTLPEMPAAGGRGGGARPGGAGGGPR